MTLALACVVNYDRKLMLQIVASLRIITYDHNSFIIQANGINLFKQFLEQMNLLFFVK